MGQRIELVRRMQTILGGSRAFIYGGYKSRPNFLPYGNYGELARQYFRADNKTYLKIKCFQVRVVTHAKDFELESKIEAMFDDLKIPFQRLTDLEVDTEHVHCVEWVIECLEE